MPTSETYRWAGWRDAGAASEPEPVGIRCARCPFVAEGEPAQARESVRSARVRFFLRASRHNRRGWRLDKPSLEQPNDSIIALCMALEAMENQPEPVQVLGWL